MKKINMMITFVIIGFFMMICLENVYLVQCMSAYDSREYRVSVNRIEKTIRDYEMRQNRVPDSLEQLETFSGENYRFICAVDALQTEHVTLEEQKAFFREEPGSYTVFMTDKGYYKIVYEAGQNKRNYKNILLFVNILTAILFMGCLFLLVYIRQKIIVPFHRLSDIPYELSKGNLTIPLQENHDRVFGKFIWGLDLLREHLEESKARELSLLREKKVLLLSLSHDIKTPLSAIKLYAKALSNNLYKSEEKKNEIAGHISDKVDEIEGYMSRIVKASNEDFLTFEVNNTEFYIRDAIDQIQMYYADKMSLNQIHFEMDSYDNCLVHGDCDRFVEVMQNVIENAIKYGDGKKIWIETARSTDEFLISICNTGCSLADKELPHIFDSFFRGSNVDKKEGSGLGLYICRKLMHLMNGEVVAEIRKEAENIQNTEDRVMRIQLLLRLS